MIGEYVKFTLNGEIKTGKIKDKLDVPVSSDSINFVSGTAYLIRETSGGLYVIEPHQLTEILKQI